VARIGGRKGVKGGKSVNRGCLIDCLFGALSGQGCSGFKGKKIENERGDKKGTRKKLFSEKSTEKKENSQWQRESH